MHFANVTTFRMAGMKQSENCPHLSVPSSNSGEGIQRDKPGIEKSDAIKFKFKYNYYLYLYIYIY